MLERERHPRFHIGESLLPANLPILERLGVLEQVAAIGVRKRGADFPAANADGFNVFRFDRALGETPPYAFQVRRDEFDELLFRHAVAQGVEAHEGAKATKVELTPEGVVAQVEAGVGGAWTVRARYLVDATGRDTFLGRQLGLRRRHPRHQSAALFAHYRGVATRTGEDAGNISIYQHDRGWAWMIPLRDGVMSVGVVGDPALFRSRREPPPAFLRRVLDAIPQARERMVGAEIVGHLHATGNYSYLCSRLAGPRWVMAGDAGAFVDPVFSTGVYLAMHSAERAARTVDRILEDPRRERALLRQYERETWAGLKTLSWFIERFTSPAMRWLFANPRNELDVERAVISMLAGDIFGSPAVRRRLAAFRLLYYAASLGRLPAMATHRRERRRRVAEEFTGGTTDQDVA
jgi:flavin-dependent dehydrogenase